MSAPSQVPAALPFGLSALPPALAARAQEEDWDALQVREEVLREVAWHYVPGDLEATGRALLAAGWPEAPAPEALLQVLREGALSPYLREVEAMAAEGAVPGIAGRLGVMRFLSRMMEDEDQRPYTRLQAAKVLAEVYGMRADPDAGKAQGDGLSLAQFLEGIRQVREAAGGEAGAGAQEAKPQAEEARPILAQVQETSAQEDQEEGAPAPKCRRPARDLEADL